MATILRQYIRLIIKKQQCTNLQQYYKLKNQYYKLKNQYLNKFR